MSENRKRKFLTLKEKIQVIEDNKKGISMRKLATIYGCGRTQINDILKKSEYYMEQYFRGMNLDTKVKRRKTGTENLDELLLEWLSNCRSKNLPISGPILQESALQIAEQLGIEDFKASNGWLEKFRLRNNIVYRKLNGEAADCPMEEATSWMETLPQMIAEYEPKDVYNCDETGLLFRAVPDKTLCLKSDPCRGGKHSKERLTVLLCSNMEGDFEKPLVVGKAAKPRCFKNLDIKKLPVIWRNNSKAWMTQLIMTEWLSELNKKMKKEKRNILLFMDNATCHPTDNTFSNVKVIFLPPNTTAFCQPLDQGVIQAFKQHYRKMQMRKLVSQMSEASVSSVSHLAKSLNVLDAVNWTSMAVKKVMCSTVKKCFAKAGFKMNSTDIQLQSDAEIPEDCTELEEIFESAGIRNMTASDFVKVDDNLAVFSTFETIQELIEDRTQGEVSDDNLESESTEVAEQPQSTNVKTYSDVLEKFRDIQTFALNNDDEELYKKTIDIIVTLEKNVCVKKRKQLKITDFLKS